MKKTLSCLLLAAITLAGGCSILNPYKSDFTCPQKENGKCVNVEKAYDESLLKGKDKGDKAGITRKKDIPEKTHADGPGQRSDLLYQDEVYRKLAGLLREPVTPLVAPPQVMRVLLLPYKGEGGELFMPRYVYFMTEDPRWIMGGYLQEGAGD